MQLLSISVLLLQALSANAHGDHGSHEQVAVAADADWATRHMAGKGHLFLFILFRFIPRFEKRKQKKKNTC